MKLNIYVIIDKQAHRVLKKGKLLFCEKSEKFIPDQNLIQKAGEQYKFNADICYIF